MNNIVTEEQGKLVRQIVSDLLVQAEATAALLSDIGGNIIAQCPGRDENETLAALAAGSFSATRELAALSGETSFNSISHEGEDTSLYAQSVAEHFILLVIFQKTTTLGLVKLYTRKVAAELESTLKEISTQCVASAKSGTTFEMSGAEKLF